MGELYLDIKMDIFKCIYGVEVEMGKFQVVYWEFIIQQVLDIYVYKKQFGGFGQYVKIDYIVEFGEFGFGFQFEFKVIGGNVFWEYWFVV